MTPETSTIYSQIWQLRLKKDGKLYVNLTFQEAENRLLNFLSPCFRLYLPHLAGSRSICKPLSWSLVVTDPFPSTPIHFIIGLISFISSMV